MARIPEADVWMAVKVEGEDASAFVCGGTNNLGSHTRWMYAEPDGDEASFEQDGVSLDVTLAVSQVTGTLNAHGQSVPVDLHLAVTKDLEGVYGAIDAGCRAGLIIVTPTDGGQQFARGAWCDDFGHFSQVTPVEPVALTPNGIEVSADTALGIRTFFVQPVHPSELAP